MADIRITDEPGDSPDRRDEARLLARNEQLIETLRACAQVMQAAKGECNETFKEACKVSRSTMANIETTQAKLLNPQKEVST